MARSINKYIVYYVCLMKSTYISFSMIFETSTGELDQTKLCKMEQKLWQHLSKDNKVINDGVT